MEAITKQAFRSGPWQEVFAQGILVADTLYLAGQVSVDAEGSIVGTNDIGEQVRQTYVNIKNVLAEFGADMDHIVDETLFVTDIKNVMENLEVIGANRAAAYGGTPNVTQTLVQVAGLVMPELLIEIKCIARVELK